MATKESIQSEANKDPVPPMTENSDENIPQGPGENHIPIDEVSQYSANEYKTYICRLLNNHLMAVENCLKEKVPLGNLRDQAIKPFEEAVEDIKSEIENVRQYALINPKLYYQLKDAKLLSCERLEKSLDYAQHIHEQIEKLMTITQTNSPNEAQSAIIQAFSMFDKICTRLDTPVEGLTDKIEEIIGVNMSLQHENAELKNTLQDMTTIHETESDLLSPERKKESESSNRYSFLQAAEARNTEVFQRNNNNRQSEQSHFTPGRTTRAQELHQSTVTPNRMAPESISEPTYFNRVTGSPHHHHLSPTEFFFKSQALPPLTPFTGENSKSVDEFLLEFDCKYSPLAFSDFERRNLFVRNLKGGALKAFYSLDDFSQKGNLSSIVDKMRQLLERNVQVSSIDAARELDTLRLESNQLLEFCDRLERLTRRAFPSMPADELSFMRAEHLYRRIAHWQNSIEALKVLETTPRAKVYDELKRLASQLERNRQHHLNLAQSARKTIDQRKNRIPLHSQNFKATETPSHGNFTNTQQSNRCHECGIEGHFKRNCPKLKENNNSGRPLDRQTSTMPQRNNNIQSNNRNHPIPGHNPYNRHNNGGAQGRQDRAGVQTIDHRPTDDTQQSTLRVDKPRNKLFVLDHSPDRHQVNSLINVEAQLNSLVVNDLIYFGMKPIYTVKIGDIKGSALIDSGAQPSTITLSTYRYIIETLPEPEKFLKLLDPLPGKPEPIYNASGEAMSIKGQVLINIRLPATEREATVVFHVIRDKPTDGPKELILGTNSFQALGIKLTFDSSTPSFPHVAPPTDTKQPSDKKDHDVVVSKRMELLPSEARWIPLEMTNYQSFPEGEALIQSTKDNFGRDYFSQALCKFDEKGAGRILLNNNSPQVMVFPKGQILGQATTARQIYNISALQLGDAIECLEIDADPTTKQPTDDKCTRLLKIVEDNHTDPIPKEIVDILKEFADYFAIDDDELRQTQLVLHDIHTGSTTPIRQKVRPVPVGVRQQFREIIENLLKRKVIEHSSSPWASPIVLVEKKDGSLRLCIDYRQLNKVIELDAYPLPSIERILQSLGGKKYFSTLDLFSGFWQIGLKDSARPKTAFITTEGLYQFRVVPFGLATSPATFQRLMNRVLDRFKDNQEVFVYIDDVLVATTTKERHFIVLREVMTALADANLAVKMSKCMFLQKSVQYLGHLVDGEGIKTDPKKVEAIQSAKPPKNVKDLRSFLGMAGYYRRFVLRFSSIAKPLFELTKNDQAFVWSTKCEEAFNKLKEVLCRAPVLSQPDIKGGLDGTNPFTIFTDASGSGIGAVLCQKGKDSLLHPLWFMSKSLTKAESRYHVTDLEALAVVTALKKFQSLIYNMKGTVVKTDHQALLSLFKKNISPRMVRWSILIQHFQVKIEYVKGMANVVADSLSRGLTPPSPTASTEICEDLGAIMVNAQTIEEPTWLTELETDEKYKELIRHLQSTSREQKERLANTGRTTLNNVPSLNLSDGNRRLSIVDFDIDEGNLWLIGEHDTPRRVVPISRRQKLFEECHKGVFAAHFSAKKIGKLLRKNFYWEYMHRDIHLWHKNCTKCFLTNAQETLTPPLRPIVTSKPFELIGVDVMELGLSTAGNRYVLVLIDHFSKFIGAYPVPAKSAEVVARTIATRWIAEGRCPKGFLSDQGGEFLNETMDCLRKLNVTWTVTKGYNPRENGITERVNKTIQRSLRKLVKEPAEWDNILPFVTLAYNSTAHDSTGDSPLFILHGFDPYLPIDVDTPPRPAYAQVDYDEYKECLVDAIRETHEIIKARNAKEMARCKFYYDTRYKTDGRRYPKVGDRVFLKLPPSKSQGKFPKLVFNIKGPYRVLETSENSSLITLLYTVDEPIRVQHDLLLIVPPSMEVPEWNAGRKRRVIPKQLGSLGRKTEPNSAQINSIICRNTNSMAVSIENPLHPMHECPGTQDGDRILLCATAQSTIGSLAEFFNYKFPENVEEITIKRVSEAARTLSILENPAFHMDTKERLLLDNSTQEISKQTWSRAYYYFILNCNHLKDYVILLEKEEMELIFDQPGNSTTFSDQELSSIIIKGLQPSKLSTKGEDLILYPSGRLLSMMPQMIYQHGATMGYENYHDAMGKIVQHQKFQQFLVILPAKIDQREMSSMFQKYQNTAKISQKLIILMPHLVTGDAETWLQYFHALHKNYQKFQEENNQKGETLCVYFFGPGELDPLQHSSPWTLLGQQLNSLTPQGTLSVIQLNAWIDIICKQLKHHEVKLKIMVNRRDSRQLPSHRNERPIRRPAEEQLPGSFPKRKPSHFNSGRPNYQGPLPQPRNNSSHNRSPHFHNQQRRMGPSYTRRGMSSQSYRHY